MAGKDKSGKLLLHNTVRNRGETLLTINKIQLTIIPVNLTTETFFNRNFTALLWSFVIARKLKGHLRGGFFDDKVLIFHRKKLLSEKSNDDKSLTETS